MFSINWQHITLDQVPLTHNAEYVSPSSVRVEGLVVMQPLNVQYSWNGQSTHAAVECWLTPHWNMYTPLSPPPLVCGPCTNIDISNVSPLICEYPYRTNWYLPKLTAKPYTLIPWVCTFICCTTHKWPWICRSTIAPLRNIVITATYNSHFWLAPQLHSILLYLYMTTARCLHAFSNCDTYCHTQLYHLCNHLHAAIRRYAGMAQ